MKINTKEFHLFKIKNEDICTYLLVKNIFPDPRSIKENVFAKIIDLSQKQLLLLVHHYIECILKKPDADFVEIGIMEGPAIGDRLYNNEIAEFIELKVLRGKENWCVFGTADSDEDFIRDYEEDIEENGSNYNKVVENYKTYYMPSNLFTNVYNIDEHFSLCTRYDYINKKWVSPESKKL